MIREKLLTRKRPCRPFRAWRLLNDIDRVLISSPGKSSPDDSAESPMLIAIHGHFDGPKCGRSSLTLARNRRPTLPSRSTGRRARTPKTWRSCSSIPKPFSFGDTKSIFATLDRNEFGPPPQATGSLLARAAEMEANYEFWVIMDAAEIVSSDQIAALFHGGEWASEAQGFEAGVNLHSGLAADITVRFSSEDTAKHVTAELTRVIDLAAKDKNSRRAGAGYREEVEVYIGWRGNEDQPAPDAAGSGKERSGLCGVAEGICAACVEIPAVGGLRPGLRSRP